MEHLKDWGPGWRYFKCGECGAHWREKCRDSSTPSIVTCVSPDCTEISSPYKDEPHYEWPTDRGNLTKEDEGVWEFVK